ncbi:MAG: thymidylate synthase [Archaeoglobus sp.]|jgi:thymidylate synthase|nr:MAG: thymidylate synthase [Archaeoglobus sp.]
MILETKAETAMQKLLAKVLEEGKPVVSRYGTALHSPPAFVVVKKPDYFDSDIETFWYVDHGSENFVTYLDRVEKLLETVAAKLRSSPFTRRASIPLWFPKDHLSKYPPAITEISFLYFNNKLNLTVYIRSLDVTDYFAHDFDLINYVLERVCELSGFERGSIGLLVGCPHVYERELEKIEREFGHAKHREVFGVTEEGTHLIEDYISSAWHSAVEVVYSGMEKATEWGKLFGGQEKCKFLPRLFIEIKNPDENQIHDKAPFSKEYGINYAHSYVIHAECIDKPVTTPVKKKEGEVYTYAERARYCEADDVKVDQLYMCMEKLRKNKYDRTCYVSISRPWDLFCNDPPCLRGYQFIANGNTLAGIFYMRSNDVFGAMHANMFAFATLTSYIAGLTKFDSYKYYHFANDAHIYWESLKAAKEILFPETPNVFGSVIEGGMEE